MSRIYKEIIVDKSEVLEWRRNGFKVDREYASGAVRMSERRKRGEKGYAWTAEDDMELKMIAERYKHLTYQQLSKFHIPERTPHSIQMRLSRLGVGKNMAEKEQLEIANEKAYQMYLNHPEWMLKTIFEHCYPGVAYQNAYRRFGNYIKKIKKIKKTPIS